MAQAKAFITDYIGTLANSRSYNMTDSTAKLYKTLVDVGFDIKKSDFLEAYEIAHEKYRQIRYGELREITNSVWVSEALSNLGVNVTSNDSRMKTALNVFFQDYVDSLELRPFGKQLLKKATKVCKIGLISNFTYAPVVYASLRKLGISHFFNAIIVSGHCGWRKPHKKIFEEAFTRLQVQAKEAVFIGDSPLEDIKGAAEIGLKSVFVASQFFSITDLYASQQKPEIAAKDLHEICLKFPEVIAC